MIVHPEHQRLVIQLRHDELVRQAREHRMAKSIAPPRKRTYQLRNGTASALRSAARLIAPAV